MAEKVLSIEIGYSLTKVCEVERGGKAPKILNSFVIETPEGMIRDGVIDISVEFVNAFNAMMEEKKIKTRKAIFTIFSSRMATRETVIPYVKEKQIVDVVRANLTDYFPVDPSAYMFSHSIIGLVRNDVLPVAEALAEIPDNAEDSSEASTDDNAKKASKAPKAPKEVQSKPTGYKIQVLAAPKPLINSYEKLAKALNLEVETIDYNGNSIYQAAKEECKSGVQLIVKIDERSALLMVIEDGVIALNRTIPYGIDEALSTLAQTTLLGPVQTYNQALELVRRKTVILNNFDGATMATETDEENANDQIRAEKKVVTDSLHNLAGGILRVIDYYNSNHSQRPIEKTYITGIGADFSGIGTLLSNELDIKVKNLTHLSGIDIEKVFKDVTYGEYVTVIGATIAPISFYADHDEAKSGASKGSIKGGGIDDQTGLFIALTVCVVGLLAAVAIVLVFLFPYKTELKNNQQYKKTIEELQPAYDTYLEYQASQDDVRYLRLIDNAAKSRNNELLDFIEILETDMPYTFCLNSVESDFDKVTLDGYVATKAEAAYAVDKLKSYDEMFTSVEITKIEAVENDLGEILYNFVIDLYFAPFTAEEVEDGEGA